MSRGPSTETGPTSALLENARSESAPPLEVSIAPTSLVHPNIDVSLYIHRRGNDAAFWHHHLDSPYEIRFLKQYKWLFHPTPHSSHLLLQDPRELIIPKPRKESTKKGD